MLAKSPKRPSTPEAPTASFPPPPLRLLPGGANQFPGGAFTRSGPAPFHGARIINDVRFQTLLVPQLLPAEHEPTHVQITQQRADRRPLRRAPTIIPILCA